MCECLTCQAVDYGVIPVAPSVERDPWKMEPGDCQRALADIWDARKRILAEPEPAPRGRHRATPAPTRPLTDAEQYETCPTCNAPPGKPCRHMTTRHLEPLAKPHPERTAKRRAVLKAAQRG
jgi:hypothetical protein